MKELQNILAKLDKLTYTAYDSTSLQTKEGFKVSVHTKFYHSKERNIPSVQVLLDVRYEGQHIQGWGCMDSEDTKLIVDFFLDKKRQAQRYEDIQEDNAATKGVELYNKL